MIDKKLLEDIEKKIREYRRALRKKEAIDVVGEKIIVEIPIVNRSMEYKITQEEKQVIEQEVSDKEQTLKDKIKEVGD